MPFPLEEDVLAGWPTLLRRTVAENTLFLPQLLGQLLLPKRAQSPAAVFILLALIQLSCELFRLFSDRANRKHDGTSRKIHLAVSVEKGYLASSSYSGLL